MKRLLSWNWWQEGFADWVKDARKKVIWGLIMLILSLLGSTYLICRESFKDVPWGAIASLVLCIIAACTAVWLAISAYCERKPPLRVWFFLEPIKTIPHAEDDVTWNSWLLKMEALLRGRGMKRQSDILSSVIRRADPPSDRPEIAENFLRGLAQIAKDNPKILGM